MKAYQLLFDNLIDINPRTGIIKFSDRRMALVSVEALGILRRDLVNTLSMERAKGFLMRYGWACGFKDGETIGKMYDWDSKKELLLAGPYLHTLEGIATVEPDTLKFGENDLHFTGFWKDSYEAQEHINHYGVSEYPVCWTLIGYASGYLTSTYGSDVLVYEESCVGKGDPHCYFVAKKFEPDNERHQQDMRHYKSKTLLTELDFAYKEVQELNENIIRSEQVQNKLTDMLLADKNVSDTVKLISDTLQKSIIIDYFHEKIEGNFIKPIHELSYINWKNNTRLESGKYGYVDSFPIQAHDANLGRMVVIGEEKLTNKEQMIIKKSLLICTIQMFHQLKLTQSIWKKKEDFFKEILTNRYDENTLLRNVHIFDFNPNCSNRILTLKVDPQSDSKKVLQYLSVVYNTIDIFSKDQYIILIVSDEDNVDIEEFSSLLQFNMKKEFKNTKVYIGAGRIANSLKDLAKSYQDASCICDFIQLAHPNCSRASYYEELEPVIMFLKGADQEELIDFCKDNIGKLVEYDDLNNGNLVLTLKAYLDYNGNLKRTADELHLSIAGLRYRIERIESLCQTDLNTGTGRFNFQLAIKIYFALQIIQNQKVFAT